MKKEVEPRSPGTTDQELNMEISDTLRLDRVENGFINSFCIVHLKSLIES